MEPYRTCFNSALEKFREMGYKTVLGPNVYADKGMGKSNTAEACGAEINDFFINDRCDAIISCGGGETMCEDLLYVDFERIAQSKPKWYLGYSDNTNLTFTLPMLCDTAAIYGPCASSFGMNRWHEAVQDAMNVLTGKELNIHSYDRWELEDDENAGPLDGYNLTEENCIKVYRGSKSSQEEHFSGRMIGGCMDCLVMHCGTRYDKVHEFLKRYEDDGIIWFMEACELDPMGVWRTLWQMENAGWFEGKIKGFIFGRPMKYTADFCGLLYPEAIMRVIEKYDVPVILDADLGHLPPMMPVISGAVGEVSAEDGKLTIRQELR